MDERKRTNSGIVAGLVTGMLVVIVHVFFDFINEGQTTGDFVLWFFQLIIYFVIALIASSSQAKKQQDDSEPLQGVTGAGRGAAMIICFLMWIYIIGRSVLLDDPGMFSGMGIGFFFGFAVFDFVLALGLGSWGGSIISRHKNLTEEE